MVDSTTLLNSTSVSWWGYQPKVISIGTERPMTKADYLNLPKFTGEYTPILFTITDPAVLMLAPKKIHESSFLNFKVTVSSYLHHNRFWKPEHYTLDSDNKNFMSLNFQGLEHSDIPKIKLEYLELVMFEMMMYHLDYDFTEYPHKNFSDERYSRYLNFVEEAREELGLPGVELDLFLPVASKSELKQVLLAVEYLHFIDYFRYQNATTLMATKQLVGDFNYWYKWNYTNSISEASREKEAKKKKVLQTTISRISEKVLHRAGGKGTVGGNLTPFAIWTYKYYLQANNENKAKPKQDDWLVFQARGIQ